MVEIVFLITSALSPSREEGGGATCHVPSVTCHCPVSRFVDTDLSGSFSCFDLSPSVMQAYTPRNQNIIWLDRIKQFY